MAMQSARERRFIALIAPSFSLSLEYEPRELDFRRFLRPGLDKRCRIDIMAGDYETFFSGFIIVPGLSRLGSGHPECASAENLRRFLWQRRQRRQSRQPKTRLPGGA